MCRSFAEFGHVTPFQNVLYHVINFSSFVVTSSPLVVCVLMIIIILLLLSHILCYCVVFLLYSIVLCIVQKVFIHIMHIHFLTYCCVCTPPIDDDHAPTCPKRLTALHAPQTF